MSTVSREAKLYQSSTGCSHFIRHLDLCDSCDTSTPKSAYPLGKIGRESKELTSHGAWCGWGEREAGGWVGWGRGRRCMLDVSTSATFGSSVDDRALVSQATTLASSGFFKSLLSS